MAARRLITGADAGGSPHVRVFHTYDNGALGELSSFYAYDAGFNGRFRRGAALTVVPRRFGEHSPVLHRDSASARGSDNLANAAVLDPHGVHDVEGHFGERSADDRGSRQSGANQAASTGGPSRRIDDHE